MERAKTPSEFSLLLDGRLSPEEERKWREKLAADPALAAGWRTFRSGVELAATAKGLSDLPPGFDARLRQRLRTEELHNRARLRAEAEAPRGGGWWQRVAIGISGVAAGVALMLALDPTSLWQPRAIQVPTASGSTVTGVSVSGIPADAMLSAREVQQLAQTKARALGEFRRTLQMGGEFRPNEVQRQFSMMLPDPSGALLENARQQAAAVGPDVVEFLEYYDRACGNLSAMLQRAEAEKRQLSSATILALIEELHAKSSKVFSCDVPERAGTEQDLAVLIQSRFEAGEFEAAASLAMRFVSEWPESPMLGTVARIGTISLHRSGNSEMALRLLDAVSAHSPRVLRGFSTVEIDQIRNTALAPRAGLFGLKRQSNGDYLLQVNQDAFRAQQNQGILTDLAHRLKLLILSIDPAEEIANNVAQRMKAVDEATQNSQAHQSPPRTAGIREPGVPGQPGLAPARNR